MAVVAAPSQAHRTEPTTFTQDGFPHVLLPTHGLHRTATTRRFRRFKPATNAAARPPDQTPKQYHSGRARTYSHSCSPIPPPSRPHNTERKAEDSGLRGGRRGRSRNEFEKGWAVIFPSRSTAAGPPKATAIREAPRRPPRTKGFWSDPRRLGGRSAVVGGGALLVSCRQRLDRPRPPLA